MKMFHIISNYLTLLMLCYFASIASAQSAVRDEIVFFLPDTLGSAVAAVNESGDLCWTETYTPYGDKTVNDDAIAGLGMPAGCGLLGEERGYTGHTEDFESDLVYAQQRYYDPSIGRFMSIDPASIDPLDVRTINRYSYAANNPYRYTDPTGEFFTPETIWDFLNIGLGAASFSSNISDGNYGSAALDGLGVVVDGIATAVPFVPGFAGATIKASRAAKALDQAGDVAKTIDISKAKYGDAAEHIADAQKAGHKDVLTIARDGAGANRKASIGGKPKVPGKQLDEYPPAMFKEGGAGASVRAISPKNNMGAGSCIGNSCRGLSNGEKIRIRVVD